MSIELNKLAAEFNRYFTSSNGVDVPAKVSVSRDEWRALFTTIQHAEAQQPATVHLPFGWWFTEDPDVFCMPGSGFSPFPNKPQHTSECIALYTHPAPGVPDGYVLVPVEPTPEMENAFRQAFTDQLHKRRNQWGRAKHTMSAEGAGLKAMLTATRAQKGGE